MQKLPGDDKLERAIISAAFVDPDFVFTEAPLERKAFRHSDHAAIWDAMLTLWQAKENVTPMTVESELSRAGVRGIELGHLSKFLVEYESPYSARALHKRLLDLQKRRELARAAMLTMKQAYDETIPIDEIVANVETSIEETTESSDIVDGGMLMDGIITAAHNPTDGGRERLFTGIGGIDSTMLGLEAGRFWVGAAVPNTGKSMFTMAIARGVMSQKIPCGVLYIHPEQGDIELSNVMLSSGTENMRPARVKLAQLTDEMRAEYARMLVNKDPRTAKQIFGEGFRLSHFTAPLTENESAQLRGSRAALRWPIKYLDPKAYNIFIIRQKIRAMRTWLTRQYGEDAFLLVVLDGMHLLSGAGEKSRVQELTTITRELKISAANDVKPGCIIANHQLNYQFYQGDMSVQSNRKYNLRGLRDSGTIGQDADVVYFIDRQTVFSQEKASNPAPLPLWDPFSIFVKKNRQTAQLFSSKFEINTATLAVRDKEEPWR